MNPIKAGLVVQAALLAVALWLIAFGFYNAPDMALGMSSPKSAFFLLSCACYGVLQSVGLFLLLRRSGRLPRGRRIVLMTAAVAAAVTVHAFVDTVGYRALFPKVRVILPASAHLNSVEYLFLINGLMLMAVYVIYMAGVGLMLAQHELREREKSLAAAREAAQEAQLAALRFQINPHFLFNALNAVSSLIGAGQRDEAGAVVSRLAEFFRASLDAAPGDLARLGDEFDVVASYLDIEAARFGPRMRIDVDCPADLDEALVPHFLLQPLVENAVKHGVARCKRPVTIAIRAERSGEGLALIVEDDAGPVAANAETQAGAGIGLRNVEARLKALFGPEAGLNAGPGPRGFAARIVLPLAFHDREQAA